MRRVFSMEEWDERGRRMEGLAARLAQRGFVIKRPPIEQQTRKSPQKRALLKKLYGPTGQS
jgi:hypothetical protein